MVLEFLLPVDEYWLVCLLMFLAPFLLRFPSKLNQYKDTKYVTLFLKLRFFVVFFHEGYTIVPNSRLVCLLKSYFVLTRDCLLVFVLMFGGVVLIFFHTVHFVQFFRVEHYSGLR